MKRKGPIFVSHLKRGKSTTSRKKKNRNVDAKAAYAFVNEMRQDKSKRIRALGKVARKVAKQLLKYETQLVERFPFRIAASLMKDTWVGKKATKLGRSLEKFIKTK